MFRNLNNCDNLFFAIIGLLVARQKILKLSKRISGLFCFVFVPLLLASCAGTSPLFTARQIDAQYSEPAEGIFYALPKGFVSLTIERKVESDKPPTLEVTMEQPIFSPDTNHIYLLKYNPNSLSSDTVEVKVDTNGLIDQVNTTSTDPIPTAIRDFSNFVVGVAKSGITQSSTEAAALSRDKKPNTGPFRVSAVFDPAASATDKGFAALVKFLDEFGVTIEVPPSPTITSLSDDAAVQQCQVLVCYRFLIPYEIVVTDSVVTNTRAEALVLLPNKGPIAGVEVVRRSLVENKFELDFTNGMLVSAKYTDPSVVIAALNIPIDVLKAIVSIPSALFQFKVSSEADTARIQKDLLTTQTALATAKLELQRAEEALNNPESNEQNAN